MNMYVPVPFSSPETKQKRTHIILQQNRILIKEFTKNERHEILSKGKAVSE